MRTILQCDRCDFHVTLPLDDPGTHRYYDLGDGHIAPVETEEAWCYNCQTMRVVEVLPSRAFIDACIDEFKESLADVDASADAFRQQLPYVEFMRRVVTSHDAWIAWLASRISPICLTCRSDQIASSGVRHPPEKSWNWTPKSISAPEKPDALIKAFSHPGCDGMLSYKDTGIYVEYTQSVEFVRFSSKGFYIDGPDQHLTAPSPSLARLCHMYRVGVKGGTWLFITDGLEIYGAENDVRHYSLPPYGNRISRMALTQDEFARYCASNNIKMRGRATVSEKVQHVAGPVTVGGILGSILGTPFGGGPVGAILGAGIAAWIYFRSDFTEERLARWFEKAAVDHIRWTNSDEQKAEQKRKDTAEYHKIAQKRWHRYHKIRNLASVGDLTGIEFEAAVASLYERNGYEVRLTKASGDFGVDLLANKGTALLAIQVKRYSDKVGVRAVQEVFSGALHYKATQAVVITDSFFTEPAQELAHSLRVQLIDKERLANMWESIGGTTSIPPFDIQQYEAIRHDIDKELRRLNVAAGKTSA